MSSFRSAAYECAYGSMFHSDHCEPAAIYLAFHSEDASLTGTLCGFVFGLLCLVVFLVFATLLVKHLSD